MKRLWKFPSGDIRADVEIVINIDGYLVPDKQFCRWCGALIPKGMKRFCSNTCHDALSEVVAQHSVRHGID
jgi:hypothetical protein